MEFRSDISKSFSFLRLIHQLFMNEDCATEAIMDFAYTIIGDNHNIELKN